MLKKIPLVFMLLTFAASAAFAEEDRLIMRPGKSAVTVKSSGGRKYEFVKEGSTPLQADCIIDASRRFRVPVSIILTVLDIEGGVVGMNAANSNRTGDLGPMQINTCHLDLLKREFGITRQEVQANGCLNVQIGAWLLRKHLDEANNNALEAIGRYHSMTWKHKIRYQAQAVKAYASLRGDPAAHIDRVLNKSNEIFSESQLR